MSAEDKRKYKRIPTNWIMKIRGRAATESQRLKIKNVSLGGVFVETRFPFEIGTMVDFDFTIPQTGEQVTAKGLVRWSNAGKLVDQPLGMGIEFIEVTSHGKEAITKFVENEEKNQADDPLAKSPLHDSLVRFYAPRVGQSFNIEILASFFGASREKIMEVVNDFQTLGILKVVDEKSVKFLPAPNDQLKAAIDEKTKAKPQ